MRNIFWGRYSKDTFKRVSKEAISTYPELQFMAYDGFTLDVFEPGDNVLVMGLDVAKPLAEAGVFGKSKGIESVRERVYTFKGVNYMITYNPDTILDVRGRVADVSWGVTLFCRYLQTGSLRPVMGSYQWVEDFSELLSEIDAEYNSTGERVEVACDLETVGFNPYDSEKRIVSIQATCREGMGYGIYLPVDNSSPTFLNSQTFATIKELLTSEKVSVRGANFKFDLRWMRQKWGLEVSNFRFDVIAVGAMFDQDSKSSLGDLTKRYVPEFGGYDTAFNQAYGKAQKSRMDLINKDELLEYAVGDVDSCLRVGKVLRRMIGEELGMQNFYVRLLHPTLLFLSQMESRGLRGSKAEFDRLDEEFSKRERKLHNECINMIPEHILDKHESGGLSLTRAALVRDYLFTKEGLNLRAILKTPKEQKPQVSEKHLLMFSNVPKAKKFVNAYAEWQMYQKAVSTYVRGFLTHLDTEGYFHPDYNVANGTVTGRSSAKDPAIQTIPKHKPYSKDLREVYDAPEGYKVFQCDYSQGELRIAADVSGDSAMLDAYLKGLDLHAVTAASLSGFELANFMQLKSGTDDEKDFFSKKRQGAKASNFGFIYGMYPKRFIEHAKDNYGVEFTLPEATEERKGFFVKYPGLERWHNRVKAFVYNNGYIVSPLGRVRHLPLIASENFAIRSEAERQAINSPIQSCLSDICFWAATFIERDFNSDELRIAGQTHDSLYGYVKDGLEHLVLDAANVMENVPLKDTFGWDMRIPLAVDCELGNTLGSVKPYEG